MGGLCNHALHRTGVAGDPASPVHRLDPRAKVVGLLGITVVAVSASPRHWPAWVACVAALTLIAAVSRVPPLEIWRRARGVLFLVLFVALFVPFLRPGGASVDLGPVAVSHAGLLVLAGVAAKATIGTLSAVLLGATTPFPEVLRALEALRVPRILTLIGTLMYRYLFVIVGEARRMRAALAARGHAPRHALRAGATGRVAAALFLRSHARGERVHLAMLSRGFDGTMPHGRALTLGARDVAFVATLAIALVGARVAAGLTA